MKENTARNLIQKLHEAYGYGFFEVTGQYGLISSWGAAMKTHNGVTALVFAGTEVAENPSRLDTAGLTKELYHIFLTGFIDLTVVILSEGKEYEHWNPSFKSIIADCENENVIYYSNDSIETASHIADAMKLMSIKKVKYSESGLPVVTITLIAVNVLYFLLSAALSGDPLTIKDSVLLMLGAKYNAGIASGQYYRLITCMFLHGGLVHILLNMYSLYCIGPLVERVYGKIKYLLIYFISGISASLLSYLMSPSMSIGASGAIFGLLGACLVLAVRMKKRIGKSFFNNILTVIAINLILGLSLPNIDNFGHIGGLLGGIVTAVAASADVDR